MSINDSGQLKISSLILFSDFSSGRYPRVLLYRLLAGPCACSQAVVMPPYKYGIPLSAAFAGHGWSHA